MICKCGGLLNVVRVEDYPESLSKQERLVYDRLCDVQCPNCGTVYHSQPYDFGKRINSVKKLKETK